MEHKTLDVLTKFQSFGLFVGGGGGQSQKDLSQCHMLGSRIFFFCGGGGGRGGSGPTARKQP